MISVVCPVLNEEKHIGGLIEFLLGVEPKEKELIFIDGGSNDRTKEILLGYQNANNTIVVLDNPKRYVPFALNKALEIAKGDPIIRIDAHSEYAPDYFIRILETFEKTGADITGGPVRMKWFTEFQRQVASAMKSKFGTGNSNIYNTELAGECDHVTFGAWRKRVFESAGKFDERLLRNQDEEFHYRAKSKGLRIYRNPEIRLWYYPRNTLRGLFRQFFEYGYFKPLVLLKMKQNIRLRHLVPALFVVYILLGLLLSAVYPGYAAFWLTPLVVYKIAVVLLALHLCTGGRVLLRSFLIYPAIHLGYGAGFLKGILKRMRGGVE